MVQEQLEEMTSRYIGARLLSFAGSVKDSKQAESEIIGIELEAKRQGIYRELKSAVFAGLYGMERV